MVVQNIVNLKASRWMGETFALLLLLFTLTNSALSWKDTTKYDYRIWTEKDGLPSTFIRDMIQTQDGFVWLVTKGGISRFNGRGFLNFTEEQYPELKDQSFRVVQQDSNGNLWLGTNDGLIQFDGATFNLQTKSVDGQKLGRVTDLLLDRQGLLWVATRGNGVFMAENIDQIGPFDGNEELEDHTIFSLAEDRSGDIWIGHRNGVQKFELSSRRLGALTFPIVPNELGYAPDEHNLVYRDIAVLPDGTVLALFGSWPHESYYLFQWKNGAWQRYRDNWDPGRGFFPSHLDGTPGVWLRHNGGLVLCQPPQTHLHSLDFQYFEVPRLIECGLELKDGSLLLAVDGQGLHW